MDPIVFRQSEVKDPYSLYEARLRQSPLHHDPSNNLWGIYGYKECKTLLSHPSTAIPALNPDNKDGLNEYAWLIQDHLVRISNPPRHEIARWTGIHLMEQMKRTATSPLLDNLLQRTDNNSKTSGGNISGSKSEIDWVEKVGKILPARCMSKSFEFDIQTDEYITSNIAALTKIMSPDKTKQQVEEINAIATTLFPMVRSHILLTTPYPDMIDLLCKGYNLDKDTAISYIVSNLIGLFIQGYDACRGLLSTALLSVLTRGGVTRPGLSDKKNMGKWAVETLRFDPTVHNTRRLVTEDIFCHGQVVKKGEILFIILAAANRDPLKFDQPALFDVDRSNNGEHMTLGAGPHSCLAKYFAVAMATETLACLFEKHSSITLMDAGMEYEPLINIRMPKKMWIEIRS
jgi:cytochrome P450